MTPVPNLHALQLGWDAEAAHQAARLAQQEARLRAFAARAHELANGVLLGSTAIALTIWNLLA